MLAFLAAVWLSTLPAGVAQMPRAAQRLASPPPSAAGQDAAANNVRLLRWLAEHGSAQGAYGLGVAYDRGQGVPRDYLRAAHWYRIAARRGSAKAQLSLAVMYQFGQGLPRDAAQAAHWFRQAAQKGLPAAQASLAALYASGEGVAKNIPLAVHWYRKAARQGSADAQLNLAELEMGPPPGRNYADAAHWLRPLACHGDPLAARWLGDLYAAGHGVARSNQTAYQWYWLAGRHDPAAAALARRVGRNLTPSERRAARRRARRMLNPSPRAAGRPASGRAGTRVHR